MKKRNFTLFITLFFLGIGFVFALNNFFPGGDNWDTNSTDPLANDKWSVLGRLDLEDSLSADYDLGKRGIITGTIESELFGLFIIQTELELTSSIKAIPNECLDSLEVYDISGLISSSSWGDFTIQANSFFCSNQHIYISFDSDSLGLKDVGNMLQGNLVDNFDKQKIAISGITTIKGDENNILNRENNPIDDIYLDTNKKVLSKSLINKNIVKYTNGLTPETVSDLISFDFNNSGSDEKIFYYDYIGQTENIIFNGNTYINKGKNLTIGNSLAGKIGVSGKNTVIAMNANIHITDDIYNTNDNNSLLLLIAKRDSDTGNGGNIYIDPSVTNIDAVLISDGSIISMQSGEIQYVGDVGIINNLRKQLLIFGSIISSNNIGSNTLVYGTDLYENPAMVNNELLDNIYDLGNLRTFNLNYGEALTNCDDQNELAPIDGFGDFITNAWAGGKNCYITDLKDPDLRESDKKNPIIIEYNSNIQLLNPVILSSN